MKDRDVWKPFAPINYRWHDDDDDDDDDDDHNVLKRSCEFISLWFAEILSFRWQGGLDTLLGSKHQAQYIIKPWSPDHLRRILHFSASDKLASSAFMIFSHFSFQVWNFAYDEPSAAKSLTWPSKNDKEVVTCL